MLRQLARAGEKFFAITGLVLASHLWRHSIFEQLQKNIFFGRN
jgi:hypothetical protein